MKCGSGSPNFAALSAPADLDAYLEGCTDDLALELPFGEAFRLEGKASVRAALTQAFQAVSFELTVREVHRCSDPDELVVEYESSGSVVADGAPYSNSYLGVFRFRDGALCFHCEYADPTRVNF
ncbi:nuclear transport factor 2 family protein [Rhodococcus sp. WS4]|nr:nuclear transport factor 2 family protein [Rhodococcus sp. WS4]